MTVTRKRPQLTRARGWCDQGERYVVSYLDGTGVRRDFGFTNDEGEARKWVTAIRGNRMWSAPKIRERKAKAA